MTIQEMQKARTLEVMSAVYPPCNAAAANAVTPYRIRLGPRRGVVAPRGPFRLRCRGGVRRVLIRLIGWIGPGQSLRLRSCKNPPWRVYSPSPVR